MTDLVPAGLGRLAAEMVFSPAQGLLQLLDVGDAVVDHQLGAVTLMHAQEFQQPLVAATQFLEQLTGQTPVEELHAAADGTRFLELGKLAVERSEVDLQHEVRQGRAVAHLALLEGEKLLTADRLVVAGLEMEPQVAPAGDARAHRQIHPGRFDHRLLRNPDQLGDGVVAAGTVLGSFTEDLILVPQIRLQQEGTLQ